MAAVGAKSLGILPTWILLAILPSLLIPTLLRAHAPLIISNLNPDGLLDATLLRLIQFDVDLPGLLPILAFSILAINLTFHGIAATKTAFKQAGFKGRDLLKPGILEEIPESMGLPSSCIYILLLFLFIPFRYFSDPQISPFKNWLDPISSLFISAKRSSSSHSTSNFDFASGDHAWNPRNGQDDKGWIGDINGRVGFPHHELATFLSALLSLLSSIMLGFLDDVFDIRWRYKIPIPIISSIPLLVVYYAGGGGTNIVLPSWPAFIRAWAGADVINLGPLYYAYISLLSTFCTNSINILAGINGVEVGQALIIALSLCINDVLYLDLRKAGLGDGDGNGNGFISGELVQRHLFSLYLLLPFVGTCIGLLAWNRYPSRVFVGDTFCYFAGQVLACAGVLGHFSKTLLLFFVPQIFNFLFSCPQLFGLVPCPRHRVPRIHEESLSLYPSTATFESGKKISLFARLLLRLGELVHLVRLYRDENGQIKECSNLTLLNAILVFRGVERVNNPINSVNCSKGSSVDQQVDQSIKDGKLVFKDQDQNFCSGQPLGPKITEYSLWLHMMGIQVLGSVLAFAVRYWIAAIVFPGR